MTFYFSPFAERTEIKRQLPLLLNPSSPSLTSLCPLAQRVVHQNKTSDDPDYPKKLEVSWSEKNPSLTDTAITLKS